MLTTEQWLHIAEESKRLGTIALEVTGGEAVTRSDFPALYGAFVKKDGEQRGPGHISDVEPVEVA